MSLLSKIARNTFWQVAGKIIGTLLGLGTVALMTRYLGQDGFGYYTAIVAYLQFFGIIIDFGLQMATTQMLSRPGADQSGLFGNIFTIRLISSLLFLSAGVGLVFLLPYPPEVKFGALIAVASFFFISLQSVLIGLFQKHLAMAEVSLAEVWGRLALLIGVWLSVTYDWGFYPIIAAVSLASFINFSLLLYQSRRYARYRLRLDLHLLKEIWLTSWPLAITISLTLVYFRADTVVLSFVRPAAAVGIYGAAYKVLEILIQFPYLFLGLILPILTESFAVNRQLFGKVIQKSFDFLAILAIPMVAGTWLLADKIIVFVAGTDFLPAAGPLRILIVAAAFIYFSALFGYAIVAANWQKKMIGFYLFNAIFALVGYIVFIPIYSYWAGAILTVITEGIITCASWYMLRKDAQIRLDFGVAIKSIISSGLMCLALSLFPGQSILTLLLAGIMIYFTALYLLRGWHYKDIMDMVRLKK